MWPNVSPVTSHLKSASLVNVTMTLLIVFHANLWMQTSTSELFSLSLFCLFISNYRYQFFDPISKLHLHRKQLRSWFHQWKQLFDESKLQFKKWGLHDLYLQSKNSLYLPKVNVWCNKGFECSKHGVYLLDRRKLKSDIHNLMKTSHTTTRNYPTSIPRPKNL